ncbi:AMIN domain-containing protein, partial [Roseovarius salinarum]|uniref:AMIN domain-containing protein n=1 Tax=Roseovarius salinarum TaxID=1981892 RepID=UPI001300110F
MIRKICALVAAVVLSGAAAAQEFSGLARPDPAQSRIAAAGEGVRIDLALSQGVPYRVFTLDQPPRLVLDFREVDWQGLDASALLETDRVRGARVGVFRPGWSRMVLDLAGPYALDRSGLDVDGETGRARLRVTLDPVSAGAFAAAAGAPDLPGWARPAPAA